MAGAFLGPHVTTAYFEFTTAPRLCSTAHIDSGRRHDHRSELFQAQAKSGPIGGWALLGLTSFLLVAMTIFVVWTMSANAETAR